jgi:DNA-binding transcriptional MerR regulator
MTSSGADQLNGSAPAEAAASGGDNGGDAARARAKKAPNAFRTISEVADELHIPQHVLRFWESKFPQVKPLKRGGGRRYYRPDDIALLRRISDLLYIQGYTIKGVQRLLREGGGRLSDDIPPAPPDEQAEAAAERHAVIDVDEQQLAMPGLERPASQPGGSPPARPAQSRADTEVRRLRGVLADVLRELEAMRALLP